MLESLIAFHCGPALAGIKPANIAACHKAQIPDIRKHIKRLNGQLNRSDIYLEILCECDKRVLVMVYRGKVLERHIRKEDNAEFLAKFGYPKGGVKECLEILKQRLKAESFPHEIGVFLGYPLYDIHGFINHDECILTGDWKVYDHAEEAKKLFSRYKACRRALVKRIADGRTLEQIFCAA